MATNKKPTLQINFYKKDNNDIGNKIKEYVEMTSNYSTNKAFIIDLVEKHLEGKVLNNKGITLKEPYYFNIFELFLKNKAKCISKEEVTNIETYNIISKIPNNLDKFSIEYDSYNYNNIKNNHLGIDLILAPDLKEYVDTDSLTMENLDTDLLSSIASEYISEEAINDKNKLKFKYIVYNLTPENELIIKLINIGSMKYHIDLEEYPEILEELEEKKKLIESDLKSLSTDLIVMKYCMFPLGKSIYMDSVLEHFPMDLYKINYKELLDNGNKIISLLESDRNKELDRAIDDYEVKINNHNEATETNISNIVSILKKNDIDLEGMDIKKYSTITKFKEMAYNKITDKEEVKQLKELFLEAEDLKEKAEELEELRATLEKELDSFEEEKDSLLDIQKKLIKEAEDRKEDYFKDMSETDKETWSKELNEWFKLAYEMFNIYDPEVSNIMTEMEEYLENMEAKYNEDNS